jgi:hypothetical protein
MATTDTNIVSLRPKIPLTPAQRAKAYRDRKKAKPVTKGAVTPVTKAPGVTKPVTPSREQRAAPIMLQVAAIGLALVGVTMNGWFARSLGSSDIAGWLFLAVGVAADLVALAIPACAAAQWSAHRRGAALAGWLVWSLTFAFALNAGIGFASINISDVTTARASRTTPAVTNAQAALSDAVTARDRECKGGVGKYCREREAVVTDRQASLNAAMLTIEQTADPQIEAASHIVAWLSVGLLRPSSADIATIRLILLALLPQLGGILLMVSRPRA